MAAKSPLTREQALTQLRAMEAELRAQGVAALYLFGSTSRDEAGADSDVDLFCDLDPRAEVGAFALMSIADDMELAIGRKVDLATRRALHQLIRADVEQHAVQVY
jgi:predicted nucleotidyltransferase